MSKNYNQISKEILENVGGKENIVSAAHCATRLRLVLKDDKKINIKAIEEMPAVKGNFNTSGQFQIILGSGVVNEVYKELIKQRLQGMRQEDRSAERRAGQHDARRFPPLHRFLQQKSGAARALPSRVSLRLRRVQHAAGA